MDNKKLYALILSNHCIEFFIFTILKLHNIYGFLRTSQSAIPLATAKRPLLAPSHPKVLSYAVSFGNTIFSTIATSAAGTIPEPPKIS